MADLHGASHKVWKLRALDHLGFIQPEPVLLRPVPPGSSWAVLKVWEGLQRLFTLKAYIHGAATTTLSRSFGPTWVNIKSVATFERAKLELLRLGVITKVDVINRACVYAPGGRR